MENQKLAKAKTRLILTQPFFASLLLPMPIIADPNIPTLATNGESIRFNPAFLEAMTLEETVFVLAHETLHCAFAHMFRCGARDPEQWNIATDYVINDLLVKEKIGVMPSVGLLDPNIVAKGGGTAEGVYDALGKKPKPKPQDGQGQGQAGSFPQPGQPGGALDSLEKPSESEAENAQKESENKVRVIQARNAAKMAGKLSAGLDRLISEAVKVETDWKAVLRRFLSERAKVDFSFARPKRRFLADDVYLPSLVGEKLGVIAVAVDCSGSVDDVLLGAFASEIKAIIEDVKPSETRVVYFDSKVLKRETYGPDDSVDLKPVGGGGTRFSPIFAALESDETPPIACVVLTDLYCTDYGPTPDFPVLWACTTDKNKVPFGEVIRIKVKGE